MVPIPIQKTKEKAEAWKETKMKYEFEKYLKLGQTMIIKHLEDNKNSAFNEAELIDKFGKAAVTYFMNKTAEGSYPNIKRHETEDGNYYNFEKEN